MNVLTPFRSYLDQWAFAGGAVEGVGPDGWARRNVPSSNLAQMTFLVISGYSGSAVLGRLVGS